MSQLPFPSKQFRFVAFLGAASAFVALLTAPTALFAQSVRHYEYADIAITYAVQRDSTVVVTERQTYNFTGEYHQGERIIPQTGSAAITNISVTDASTGQPLIYAGVRTLDKTNSENWGKYTVTTSGGNTVIDWYYDLSDTTHTWVLTYTLHGAITFAKDHDELYWNLFDSYTVPVLQTSATVVLPEADTNPSATFYVRGEHNVVSARPDDQTFRFTASNFAPGEAATVAVGWQKGLVTEQSYWLDWLRLYWQYGLAALAVALTLGYAVVNSLFFRPDRRTRTVVAAYEPPAGMPPAVAGSLLGIAPSKALPVTTVDLAVRGYLTIQELPSTLVSRFRTFGGRFWQLSIILFGVLALLLAIASSAFLFGDPTTRFVLLVPALTFVSLMFLVIFSLSSMTRRQLGGRQYTLTRTQKSGDDLADFERTLLDALFDDGAVTFSTADVASKDTAEQARMQVKAQLCNQEITAATDALNIYTHSHESDHKGGLHVIVALVWPVVPLFAYYYIFYRGARALLPYVDPVVMTALPYVVLFWAAVLSYTIIRYTTTYELLLNEEGQGMRDALLGFKLYLATAERYRMQNLTQETFEKYLPYAMLFGVEKKWVRAFAGVNMTPSSWYAAAPLTAADRGAANFSAAAFSSSFSASFTSAVNGGSSGGFSGGGGFAGGGGGGGGGGAS